MKLYKTENGIFLVSGEKTYHCYNYRWDKLVNRDDLYDFLKDHSERNVGKDAAYFKGQTIQAPINQQEIWAAGVTYLRSREARMEEAKDTGGADFYAKVYEAHRPELFFKSTASRCAGDGEAVYIRRDSNWNVPEPELTLFATSSGKIVGYTIGNDMSSRVIEGENPLYLPQAKSYDKSAAIGPCLYVPEKPIEVDTKIAMEILRRGENIFSGTISINQMKRTHEELIGFLFREMSFPQGVYLMTGTCLVPSNEFTLHLGDIVRISIDDIGTLTNTVFRREL